MRDGVRRIRQLGVWGSISEAVVSAGMDRTGCDAIMAKELLPIVVAEGQSGLARQ